MEQYILLQSYVGSSDFTYHVESTGSMISVERALALGLTSRDELGRHCRSDYSRQWHAIQPGDRITVWIVDAEADIDRELVFTIPDDGLVNPPVSLDDERIAPKLHEYLTSQCECIESDNSNIEPNS